MVKRFLSLAVIFFILSCNVEHRLEHRDGLLEAVNNFNEAFKIADVEKLGSLVTENYVHTNSTWKSFGKDQWLGYIESRKAKIEKGELEITSYEMQDLEMVVHGQSALVTGKIVSKGLELGVPFQSVFRVSNYWVYEQGTWKRAGFHDTKITPNPAR